MSTCRARPFRPDSPLYQLRSVDLARYNQPIKHGRTVCTRPSMFVKGASTLRATDPAWQHTSYRQSGAHIPRWADWASPSSWQRSQASLNSVDRVRRDRGLTLPPPAPFRRRRNADCNAQPTTITWTALTEGEQHLQVWDSIASRPKAIRCPTRAPRAKLQSADNIGENETIAAAFPGELPSSTYGLWLTSEGAAW